MPSLSNEDDRLRDTLKDFEQLAIAPQKTENESNELDCKIDELAEYFSHFVNVQVKMSPLAEAMYT